MCLSPMPLGCKVNSISLIVVLDGFAPPEGERPAPLATDSGPIFVALQAQLGLKLEQKKGLSDRLVIDHIEKWPTQN
jgi:uncharacterized protein (TIGR03435 family)